LQRNIRVPTPISIYIFLWGFGIIGIAYAMRRRKQYIWPFILLIVLIPIVFFYPDRFWGAHSFIPLSILAAFGVYYVYILLKDYGKKRFLANAVLFITLLVVVITVPVFNTGTVSKVSLNEATLPALVRVNKNHKLLPVKNKMATILNKRNILLANFIKTHSKEGDTIYVPDGALSDFIFAFSGCSASSGMLREVQPYKRPFPTDCSFFVIDGTVDGLPPGLNDHFILFGKVAGYTVFKNKYREKPVFPEKPIFPNWVALLIIYFCMFVVIYDLLRKDTLHKHKFCSKI